MQRGVAGVVTNGGCRDSPEIAEMAIQNGKSRDLAGRVTVELPFSPRISQQQGLFPGAVIGALADTAGGYAAMSLMPAGSEVSTVEYKINFVGPAKGAMLRATAGVVTSGRTLCVVRVEVLCLDDSKSDVCAIMQANDDACRRKEATARCGRIAPALELSSSAFPCAILDSECNRESGALRWQ